MSREILNLAEVNFTAFDTETTGLIPVAGRIVELGAVRFCVDGTELETYEQLVDPEDSIPEDVQRIHGISNEMIRGQPTIEEALPDFVKFLRPDSTLLLAHNAAFDIGFIGVELTRLNIPCPAHRIYDTMLLAQSLCPTFSNYKLETLAVEMQIAEKEDHRALSDARLTKEVFLALLDQAPSIRSTAELDRFAPPLSFFDSQVFEIDPPPGFEDLGRAMEGKYEIVIVYEGGTKGLQPRNITPKLLMNRKGMNYLVAYCHTDRKEKYFRMDRIREYRLVNDRT